MKTAIAISPMMTNVLSVAKIPPATMTTSQMARIAPRIVPMTRPMSPVCARRSWQPTAAPARAGRGPPGMPGRTAPGHRRSSPAGAGHVVTAGLPGPARTSGPARWLHGGTSPRRGPAIGSLRWADLLALRNQPSPRETRTLPPICAAGKAGGLARDIAQVRRLWASGTAAATDSSPRLRPGQEARLGPKPKRYPAPTGLAHASWFKPGHTMTSPQVPAAAGQALPGVTSLQRPSGVVVR